MSLEIEALDSFVKEVKKLYKKYKNIKKDLISLQQELMRDPKKGIFLGNSCYKIRVQNSSIISGKSGGFRVIYYYVDDSGKIYLISIYSKSEIVNISDQRILQILKDSGIL